MLIPQRIKKNDSLIHVRAIYLLVFYSLLYNISYSQTDTIAKHYGEMVTAPELKKQLNIIASDEYEGRETTKPGQKKAAEYIANYFKNAGIPPYKDNTYLQHFPVTVKHPEKMDITIRGKHFEQMKDYYMLPGCGEQRIEMNEVICLGYGINSTDYDDFKGRKIKNKIIMVFAGEPFTTDSLAFATGKKGSTAYALANRKSSAADAMDASAMFIVVNNIADNINRSHHSIVADKMKLEEEVAVEKSDVNMPVIYISLDMADEILSAKSTSVDGIKKRIFAKKKPLMVKAKIPVVIDIKKQYEKAESENVLGYIEGSDLKEELVIVTGHYDHLGIDNDKEGDKIYNGADDDGTGTVSVMELSRIFSKAKKEGHGPRRSMLFMTVAGEEKGLLGSKYYTAHPEFPLSSTIVDLNIDMIGRWDEKHKDSVNFVYLIGADKMSSELNSISEEANRKYTGLKLDYTYNNPEDPNRFYYRSDHYNFVKKNIPVIFYFNGVHADYHKVSDEVSKINFSLTEKRAKLVFYTAWELANRKERLKLDVK